MATAFVSTNAELIFLNMSTQSGVISLPSIDVPGRILTFKDRSGGSLVSSITFSTGAPTQFLENNASQITVRNPFGAYSFLAGSDNKWYTIGGSQMYSANISSILSRTFNVTAISSGSITTSTLQMRDTQTTSTNTMFSQSTLLFYSSPVSFFLIGPSKAPKPLFTRIRAPFIPTQIAGLALWLDAADQNTFSGGRIWFDKSGTRNHATTGTPGTTTMPSVTSMNGLSAAQFLAANATSAITTNNINAFSVTYFIVFRVNAVAAGPSQQWLLINNTDGQRQLQVFNPSAPADTFPTQLYSITNSSPPFGANLITSALNRSELNMVSWTVPATSAGTSFTYLNGSIAATTAQIPLFTPDTANSQTFIGSANGPSGYITADIGEILIYNSDFSAAPILQRQQVEGYLAWKWGLVSQLPSAHPYKNSPP